MSLQPTAASQAAARLIVERETTPGAGWFEVDERLRATEVVLGSDLRLSSAVIEVRTDGSFGAAGVRDTYHPGVRFVVRTDESEAFRRTVLFEGFVPVTEANWDVADEESAFGCCFRAEHVAGQVAAERVVLGRHVRSLLIERRLAADPDTWQGRSEWVAALPCIFNFDGLANCAAEPLVVRGADGSSMSVHIFCGEGDAGAEPWTYARALRYLAWFYRLRGGPVADGNLFSATEPYAGLSAAGPATIPRSDVMGLALCRVVDGVCCEGMNAVEALAVVAESAGLHITAETASEAGKAISRWRLWAAAQGKTKTLRLRGRAAGASARQVLADNNLGGGAVRWDLRRVVHRPIVFGGVKQLEVTVSLWPGWLPEPNLDNVPAEQREAAKALAWTPDEVFAQRRSAGESDWFKRYHRQGSQFVSHAAVGRRWVLNEDGRYAGALYNRNEPFDSYKAFDFASVVDGGQWHPQRWMRRPRRFLPTASATPEGQSVGVWVEASFDSGATWCGLAGTYRVLADECGVCFDCANPTEIVPPGVDPREQNMWYALIDQTFRVRVTAVIETDERLTAGPAAEATWRGAPWHQREVRFEPDAFGYLSATGGSSVLAAADGQGAGPRRDDSAAIAALAAELAREGAIRLTAGNPRIPWIDREYEIGDRIVGVSGPGVGFDVGGGVEKHAPVVVGKRYRLAGGRYETELLLGACDKEAERCSA